MEHATIRSLVGFPSVICDRFVAFSRAGGERSRENGCDGGKKNTGKSSKIVEAGRVKPVPNRTRTEKEITRQAGRIGGQEPAADA